MTMTGFFECDPTDPNSPSCIMENERMLQHYPYLVEASILFLYKEKASKRNGHPVMGKVTKVSPVYRTVMEHEFIIQVAYTEWQELSPDRKKAWLDHFLAQCHGEEDEKTGDIKYKVRKPPIGGFPEVVGRHGVEWHPELVRLRAIPRVQQACAEQVAFSADQGTQEEVADA